MYKTILFILISLALANKEEKDKVEPKTDNTNTQHLRCCYSKVSHLNRPPYH